MPRTIAQPKDGPPVMAVHLAHIARSGEPEDSESMSNAKITISRLSTFDSARVYSTYLARFFAYMRELGKEPIRADTDDIDMYLQTLRQYAPTTRGTHYGVLKGYFKRAVERDKIQRNPVVIRTSPPEPKNPTPALTVKQAQSLLDGIAADLDHPDRGLSARRDYTLVGMALFLCMRATELSDVRWKGISRTRGKLTISFMGKGRKAATIGLPDQVFEMMLAWKAAYEKATGVLLQPNDPILLGVDAPALAAARKRKGAEPLPRLSTRGISRLVAGRITEAEMHMIDGVPGVRFAAHCLRSTGATLALESGADILDIQALLRHIKLDTTIKYLRRLENRSARAMEKIPLRLLGDKTMPM